LNECQDKKMDFFCGSKKQDGAFGFDGFFCLFFCLKHGMADFLLSRMRWDFGHIIFGLVLCFGSLFWCSDFSIV